VILLRILHTGPFLPLASHYTLLQVAEQASAEELRQAFRRLSKRFHPDTTSLPATEAEQAFQRLRQAYAVLIDPESRRRYDTELRLARLTAAALAARSAATPLVPSVPSVRRALSGGEWLALLLLALALVFSLVLGVGLALARGAAFSTWPSWLPPS
jgi:curved DNA-binding protein CbpA